MALLLPVCVLLFSPEEMGHYVLWINHGLVHGVCHGKDGISHAVHEAIGCLMGWSMGPMAHPVGHMAYPMGIHGLSHV